MSPSADEIAPDETCITCGDVALPLTVDALVDDGTAVCTAEDGGREEVATELVGPVEVGETVLVHARVAIARLGTTAGTGGGSS